MVKYEKALWFIVGALKSIVEHIKTSAVVSIIFMVRYLVLVIISFAGCHIYRKDSANLHLSF